MTRGIRELPHVVRSGVVYSSPDGNAQESHAFPSICVCTSSRWLCAFRAAPRKAPMRGQRVLLTWSDDLGQTWSDPVAPFTPPDLDGKPGLFRCAGLASLPDGRIVAAICWVEHADPDLPFFNDETEGLLDTRIFLAFSEDEGETWSDPAPVNTAPYPSPTPITGPPLALPGGGLACQFELNKPYEDPEPWRHLPVLLFSDDGGLTWPRHTVPAQDPENRIFFWDQRPSVLPGGQLFNVFWTFDRERGDYLPIHTAESWDEGATWTAPRATGVMGQPAPVFELNDGSWAMVYVDRMGAPAIRLRRSTDDGRTWPAATEETIDQVRSNGNGRSGGSMQETWAEMGAFALGLPAAAQLPDGGGVIVYYGGSHADRTSIRWALAL